MAQIEKVEDKWLVKIYNVDGSVGLNIQSKRDDVLLVQVLLNIIYEDPKYRPEWMENVALPAITGHCGNSTAEWIGTFQMVEGKSYDANIQPDGIVNHARTPKVKSPRSGNRYSIYLLNYISSVRSPAAYLLLIQNGIQAMIPFFGATD